MKETSDGEEGGGGGEGVERYLFDLEPGAETREKGLDEIGPGLTGSSKTSPLPRCKGATASSVWFSPWQS